MARAPGEGTIRKRSLKRADGSTYVRWFAVVTVPSSGKRVEGPWRETQREANVDRRQMLAEIKRSEQRGESAILLTDYLQQWLESRKSQLRPNTYTTYEGIVRNHIAPNLAPYRLDELTPLRIQQALDKIAEGSSPSTAAHVRRVLNNALNYAVRLDVLEVNPAARTRIAAVKRQSANIWEPDETRRFLKASEGHPYELLYRFALTFGLRAGELLGLQWRDINETKRTLTVRHQLLSRCKADKPEFGPPKAGEKRWLPVPQDILVRLEPHRATQALNPYDLVFTTDDGDFIPRISMRHAFRRLCRDAGVRVIRIHDLRHTAASLWIRAGLDVQTVAARLGHRDARTTIAVYMHALNERLEQDISIEDMIR